MAKTLVKQHTTQIMTSRRKPLVRIAVSDTYSPKVFSFADRGKSEHIIGLTGIGEIVRNDDCLNEPGHVDLTALRRKLKRVPSVWDIVMEFDRLNVQIFTAFEYGVIRAVSALQSVNNDFARVWGGARNGKLLINLSVEFRLFDDDVEGWRRMRRWIAQEHGIENVMNRAPHLDKPRPLNQKRWNYGPDHGRPETQIDVIWDVTHMSLPQLEQHIERLRSTGQHLWSSYGVGVV